MWGLWSKLEKVTSPRKTENLAHGCPPWGVRRQKSEDGLNLSPALCAQGGFGQHSNSEAGAQPASCDPAGHSTTFKGATLTSVSERLDYGREG